MHRLRLIHSSTIVWLALMFLTLTTYAIGEAKLGGLGVMLMVLGTAVVKVQMVSDHFMGLRRTRWLWRGIVLGWLLLVAGLVMIAYLSAVN